ncbi:WD repeat-containing protein WRAP73-like isoform X2 [Liolophura sinensis]|uniref:WD repeat-containing protein WRAP73-like isoform X2 n=1 Tax=Liolophura sinensis TaxID=3198878 RepID=UPI0031589CA9
MNFSELFKHTGLLCRFSPDGKYLASVVQYRLVIRDVETLQVLNLFSCVDTIQYIEWSVDSQFVLCGMYKRALVQVWSLENPDWTCKIDEGSAGLSEVRWGPDGRHILTTAEFHLRITVWSLLNKTVSYIKYPKQCQKGVDFSTGGKYMALAERRDCKDYVSVFACSTWELVKHFETATEDLAGLEWSPDGRVLAVWESLLQVRILNHITWKTVTEEDHPATIDTNNVIVYKETENRPPVLQGESTPPRSSLFSTHSKYEIEPLPASIPVVKPDPKKANPKMGVGSLSFSCNCQYMISRNDNMPHTLWVWDVQRLSLAVVLVQAAPIKCIDWDPCQPRLALCTGTNKLYMWSPAGCLSVEIPAEASFHIQSVKWHPGGEALLLIGKDEMCVCFLSNSSQETRTEDS